MSGSAEQQAEHHRTLNRSRRLGYRLLPGEGFSYILHLRPLEWPIMTAHTALGWLLALASDSSVLTYGLRDLASVLLVWVVLLNGGTLALNSAFDADAGDIGYLDAPPPPPAGLAAFALALMFLGGFLAFGINARVGITYCVCATLSVAYSVPPLRLKAVAGADWIINVIGFGALTPLAGWFAAGVPPGRSALLIFSGFGFLFAAFYPLTQIYQTEEDRARGDRTLVLFLGEQRSLRAAVLLACIAFVFFAAAAASVSAGPLAALLLGGAAAAWLVVLLRWLRHFPSLTAPEHKARMYHALAAWAATDAAVISVMFLRA